MNKFFDVTAATQQRTTNQYSDTKSLPSTQPVVTQSTLLETTNSQSHQSRNQSNVRRKHQTFQVSGKKRNLNSATTNNNIHKSSDKSDNLVCVGPTTLKSANIAITTTTNIANTNKAANNFMESRSYQHFANHSNQNVNHSYWNKNRRRDSFNASIASSSLSDNSSDSGCGNRSKSKSIGVSSNRAKNNFSASINNSNSNNTTNNKKKSNPKSNAMDMRSTRLLMPQTNQHLSYVSPNSKTVFNMDYLHQMGTQMSDSFCSTQHSDFSNNNRMNNSNRSTPSSQSMTQQQNHQQQQHQQQQQQQLPGFYQVSRTIQQMYSPNNSPNNQNRHHNQNVGIYNQQNMSSYHPNNNYHSNNRQNHNAGRKSWSYSSNNRQGRNKAEPNGNYCSSNSSTASSSNSNEKLVSHKFRMESNEASSNKSNSAVDKTVTKSEQSRSPTLSLKALSLSDSEASNPKVKDLPSDYFRLPRIKAASCTSSLSSPIMSTSPPSGQSSSLSTSSINSQPESHPFFLSMEKDSTATKAPSQDSYFMHNKSDKNAYDRNGANFLHSTRRNFSMSSGLISAGSAMLSDDMPANSGPNNNRFRLNNQNMVYRDQTYFNLMAPDGFSNSPIRNKQFLTNHTHYKRRSSTPSNRMNLVKTTAQRQDDIENDRGMQYRSRVCGLKTAPPTLLDGSVYDKLTQSIWDEYMKRRQPHDVYEKKTYLWSYLNEKLKTAVPRLSLYLVGSTISGFALDSSDVDMCLVSRLRTSLEPRIEAVSHLDRIKSHLLQDGQTFLRNFNLIPAKVPILRFDDTHHKVEVDLNYNNCVGIRNSHLLYCYTQMDWRLQPLAVIVKLWARYHDINNAKDFTISSYSLILMVIHYLQCGVQPVVLPCLHDLYPKKFAQINDIDTINMNEKLDAFTSENNQTLGELFVGFLEYFSHFYYDRNAISIRTAGVLPIDECRRDTSVRNDPADWRQLCIEEPFDRSNTARSCCDERIFDRIKTVFAKSWRKLRDTNDLNSLFCEQFAPPQYNQYYDNYVHTPIPVYPLDYPLRTF